MSKLAYQIGNESIVLVLDGTVNTIPRSAANAKQILAELLNAQPDISTLKELVSVTKAIKGYSNGRVVISTGGEVTLDGEALPAILAERVLQCYEQQVPFHYLINFFDRLKANPSARAVTELYTFLEHKSMPITPEGHILAYKGVQENGYSLTGNLTTKVLRGTVNDAGQIYNGIGETIEVQRNNVDDDCNVGCSKGLHAGSLSYATGFGPETVIVSIDPADVVSVPRDCEFQKLRCCQYKVVSRYQGELGNGGVSNERNPYSSFRQPVDECPGLDVEFACSCHCTAADKELQQAELVDIAIDEGSDDGEADASEGNTCDSARAGREYDSEEEVLAYHKAYAQSFADSV